MDLCDLSQPGLHIEFQVNQGCKVRIYLKTKSKTKNHPPIPTTKALDTEFSLVLNLFSNASLLLCILLKISFSLLFPSPFSGQLLNHKHTSLTLWAHPLPAALPQGFPLFTAASCRFTVLNLSAFFTSNLERVTFSFPFPSLSFRQLVRTPACLPCYFL